MKRFITRHPAAAYFALTLAISWGGVLSVVGFRIPTAQEAPALFPYVLAPMLAGPTVSGLLFMALVHGKAGFRDLLSRLSIWRVGLRWYAVALLTAPLVTFAVLTTLSAFSTDFVPGIVASEAKWSLLLFAMAAAIPVGILEELGWTGFATPTLRRTHGVLATGLMVGIPWGAWHLTTNGLWSAAGADPLGLFLVIRFASLLFGGLPAFRVLMVWVYEHTGGSLPIAMLMHVSITAASLTMSPLGISGSSLLIADVVGAAAQWAVVAVVALASHGELTRRPMQLRTA